MSSSSGPGCARIAGMITIDRAAASDRDALYRLFCDWDETPIERTAFDASFSRVLASPSGFVLVAREGVRLVGYAQVIVCDELGFERFYEIAALLVANDARDRGIGRMLVERVETLARESDIREIKLSSQVYRSRAHVFYERQGFEFYKISKFYSKRVV